MKAWISLLPERLAERYGNETPTITQIARDAGIPNRSTVYRWLSKEPLTQLNAELMTRFAEWLDCNMSDLIEEVEIEDPERMAV